MTISLLRLYCILLTNATRLIVIRLLISSAVPANGSLTTPGSSSSSSSASAHTATGTTTAETMQHETSSNGGDDTKLAADHNGKLAGYANGTRLPAPLLLDKTDREIVRLIGQHLKIVGLE